MTDIDKDKIRQIVLDVLKGVKPIQKSGDKPVSSPSKGPYVLCLFHAGIRKLDDALNQVREIEKTAGKCGVYTGESARMWVCGRDVREKAGTQCILDNVKSDGLDRVLQRADIVILPTFCFKVAAKVAHLTCDTLESNIVLSALLQGKQVLATRDSFLVCDLLINENLRVAIDRILKKLEGFGMVFCETEQLNTVFQQMVSKERKSDRGKPEGSSVAKSGSPLALVTAKAVQSAVDQKKDVIALSAGGVVTPLARDLAKEYSIKIVET